MNSPLQFRFISVITLNLLDVVADFKTDKSKFHNSLLIIVPKFLGSLFEDVLYMSLSFSLKDATGKDGKKKDATNKDA